MTAKHGFKCLVKGILIHTSVKLVTTMMKRSPASWVNFNPHEREARDDRGGAKSPLQRYFNPHEREARDLRLTRRTHRVHHFNPHEREARDRRPLRRRNTPRNFNPHEREARDASGDVEARSL